MKITIIQADTYSIENKEKGKTYTGTLYAGFTEQGNLIKFSCPDELNKSHQVHELEMKFNPELCENITLKRKIFGEKITYTEQA